MAGAGMAGGLDNVREFMSALVASSLPESGLGNLMAQAEREASTAGKRITSPLQLLQWLRTLPQMSIGASPPVQRAAQAAVAYQVPMEQGFRGPASSCAAVADVYSISSVPGREHEEDAELYASGGSGRWSASDPQRDAQRKQRWTRVCVDVQDSMRAAGVAAPTQLEIDERRSAGKCIACGDEGKENGHHQHHLECPMFYLGKLRRVLDATESAELSATAARVLGSALNTNLGSVVHRETPGVGQWLAREAPLPLNWKGESRQ